MYRNGIILRYVLHAHIYIEIRLSLNSKHITNSNGIKLFMTYPNRPKRKRAHRRAKAKLSQRNQTEAEVEENGNENI